MSRLTENAGPATVDVTPRGPTASRCRLVLAVIICGFFVARLPIALRLPGGQDECWFAVPGETVAREGIPRIPYAPVRNPDSVFYLTDEAMFALPPAVHYAQAPFFRLLRPGYATARIPSLCFAALSILLVYLLATRLLNDSTAGLWGAGLYSLSRVLYFPAILARPDTLCAACGLAAVWAMAVYSLNNRLCWLLASGLLTGLGALTHPFAIVFGIQLGVWCLCIPGTAARRLGRCSLWAGAAGAVLALWTPLIVAHPDAFQHQFFNNVLNPSGPGLAGRLLWPWPYFIHQGGLLWEHAGPYQAVMMLVGLIGTVGLYTIRKDSALRLLAAIAVSGVYLHTACQGSHVAKGYWCYTGALLFLCVGQIIAVCGRRLAARGRAGRVGSWCGALLLLALMLPGSGIRLWTVHIIHWSDPAYDARRFASALMDDLEADARYVVAPEFVLDFHTSGRQTVLELPPRKYYGVDAIDYDYLIIGPDGIANDRAAEYNGEFIRAYGDPENEFACYAELYRRSASAPAAPWPYDATFEEDVAESTP